MHKRPSHSESHRPTHHPHSRTRQCRVPQIQHCASDTGKADSADPKYNRVEEDVEGAGGAGGEGAPLPVVVFGAEGEVEGEDRGGGAGGEEEAEGEEEETEHVVDATLPAGGRRGEGLVEGSGGFGLGRRKWDLQRCLDEVDFDEDGAEGKDA